MEKIKMSAILFEEVNKERDEAWEKYWEDRNSGECQSPEMIKDDQFREWNIKNMLMAAFKNGYKAGWERNE